MTFNEYVDYDDISTDAWLDEQKEELDNARRWSKAWKWAAKDYRKWMCHYLEERDEARYWARKMMVERDRVRKTARKLLGMLGKMKRERDEARENLRLLEEHCVGYGEVVKERDNYKRMFELASVDFDDLDLQDDYGILFKVAKAAQNEVPAMQYCLRQPRHQTESWIGRQLVMLGALRRIEFALCEAREAGLLGD